MNSSMLNNRQRRILDFCKTGRQAAGVARHLGLTQGYVYTQLSLLQRLGLLAKTEHKRDQPSTFTTIGTEPRLDGVYERFVGGRVGLVGRVEGAVEGASDQFNTDFIRHGHNIFRRAA